MSTNKSELAHRRNIKGPLLYSGSIAKICIQGKPNTASATGTSATAAGEALKNAYNKTKRDQILAFTINDTKSAKEKDEYDQGPKPSTAAAGTDAQVKPIPQSDTATAAAGAGSSAHKKPLAKSKITATTAGIPVATAAPISVGLPALSPTGLSIHNAKGVPVPVTPKLDDKKSKFEAALESRDPFTLSHFPTTGSDLKLHVDSQEPMSPGTYVSRRLPSKKLLTLISNLSDIIIENVNLKMEIFDAIFEIYNFIIKRDYKNGNSNSFISALCTAEHEARTGEKIKNADHLTKGLDINKKIENICDLLKKLLVDIHFPLSSTIATTLTTTSAITADVLTASKLSFGKSITDENLLSLRFIFLESPDNLVKKYPGFKSPTHAEKQHANDLLDILDYFAAHTRAAEKISFALKEYSVKNSDRNQLFKQLLSRKRLREELFRGSNSKQLVKLEKSIAKIKAELLLLPENKKIMDEYKKEDMIYKAMISSINVACLSKLSENEQNTLINAYNTYCLKKDMLSSTVKTNAYQRVLSLSENNSIFSSDEQIKSVCNIIVKHALTSLNHETSIIIREEDASRLKKLVDQEAIMKHLQSFCNDLHQLQYIGIYDDKPQLALVALNELTEALTEQQKSMAISYQNELVELEHVTLRYTPTVSKTVAKTQTIDPSDRNALNLRYHAINFLLSHSSEVVEMIILTIKRMTSSYKSKGNKIDLLIQAFAQEISTNLANIKSKPTEKPDPLSWYPHYNKKNKLSWLLCSRRKGGFKAVDPTKTKAEKKMASK